MNDFFHKMVYATSCVYELARGAIVFLVLVTLVHLFVMTLSRVNGGSMEPNFEDGQYVLVKKLDYLWRQPRRGEVVTLRFPGDPERTRYIKRIIGLPNEVVSIINGEVYINNKRLAEPYIPKQTVKQRDIKRTLSFDEYFVMGDHRDSSSDSRIFGPIERRFILGNAFVIVWPFRDAEIVPPEYYSID